MTCPGEVLIAKVVCGAVVLLEKSYITVVDRWVESLIVGALVPQSLL